MTATSTPLDHLHHMLGPDASFRPGQLETIETVARDRGRVLLVQRTGWGKRAVYFIAPGSCRVNRVRRPDAARLAAARPDAQPDRDGRAHGRAGRDDQPANPEELEPIAERLANDEIDLLLISPERLANEKFRGRMLGVIARAVGLLVVDEAHCISDWGHDFRPDYRRIVRMLDLLPRRRPRALQHRDRERPGGRRHRRPARRAASRRSCGARSIARACAGGRRRAAASRTPRLAERDPPALGGSGIVYCLTIADAERVAEWLKLDGHRGEAYCGATENEDRLAIEQALLNNELKVLVAT